jgi:FkbM family methyltransferase
MLSKPYQSYDITNNVDKEFYSLMEYVNNTEMNTLEKIIKRYLTLLKQRDNILYDNILKYYNEYKYWGKLMPENDIYELIHNRTTILKRYLNNIIWLYNRLEDYHSKKCLLGIISHWVTFDSTKLSDIKDNKYKHYFDLDVMICDEREVLVDLGAYTGDTVIDYISIYGKYKKIYCYEIVPSIFEKLKEDLEKFPNIEFRQKGAHENKGYMYISDNEPHESMHKLSNTGELIIPTVAIDEDICEPITFIKMDIEGGEKEALRGCRNHIRAEQPKLAISVYHSHEDIWRCAEIIDEIITGYKLYLRYYGENIYPAEYVLLATH